MTIPEGLSHNTWMYILGRVSLGTKALETDSRVSRMQEICTSGSMRGAASPPLLDHFRNICHRVFIILCHPTDCPTGTPFL